MRMLILFDLDGTLISPFMEAPGRRFDRWETLPGRLQRLAALRAEGHRVGIVTNQGGVAFGYVTEVAFRRKLAQVLRALELPRDTPVAVCFAHPKARIARYRDEGEVARRKPGGAMLRELIERLPSDAADGVLYVGDRDEDEAAARDAGVPFAWAGDYFARGPR